ncbi:MAG TPA: DUF5597 domain-containing protein [Bryobacteraceae bacterium]|nr:DUF5597 domain-containing protein [Bryobacteraceae bacterium]
MAGFYQPATTLMVVPGRHSMRVVTLFSWEEGPKRIVIRSAFALIRRLSLLSLWALPLTCAAQPSTPAPQLVEKGGRHAFLVNGSPYLILGAQIGNSSSWPEVLPEVWPALEAMHVNTAEAPVYWEQIEPEPAHFDWTNVDALLDGARAHHMHLIVLWFGTWKNGNDHYVPLWVKRDPAHFPRMLNRYGTPLDVLSANSSANLDADRRAFTALTRHLAERDGQEHTILMIQVENESGAIGTVRDYSPEANRQFAGAVPAELVEALNRKPGTWAEVFPGNADEVFQGWAQARYINAIAEAGKRELPIPMYCNVWLAYPPAELPERRIPIPGIGYPSGGPVQTMLSLWKIAAPSIDAIGPDIYSSDPGFYLHILNTYNRPDNPLWIPETGQGNAFAPFFFAALGRGAIGFSPFGVDRVNARPAAGDMLTAHAENYHLFAPMDRTIAKLNFAGEVQAAIEAAGGTEQELLFEGSSNSTRKLENTAALPGVETLANATVPLAEAGSPATRAADAKGAWAADIRFGFPQRDGQHPPGNSDHLGRVMVAQLGPDEFLLAGFGGSVFFHRPGFLPGIRMQILKAEQGYYTAAATPGGTETWHTIRWLNGDETDRGIRFFVPPADRQPLVVRILLGRF